MYLYGLLLHLSVSTQAQQVCASFERKDYSCKTNAPRFHCRQSHNGPLHVEAPQAGWMAAKKAVSVICLQLGSLQGPQTTTTTTTLIIIMELYHVSGTIDLYDAFARLYDVSRRCPSRYFGKRAAKAAPLARCLRIIMLI